MKPYHKHDCDKCQYLGSMYTAQGPVADWYQCSASVIARFSSAGPDYWSMDIGMVQDDRYLLVIDGTGRKSASEDRQVLSGMAVLARYMLTRTKLKGER